MEQETKTATFERRGRELIHTRLLNAPRELVWEVWTDPEHIKNWWGPNGFSLTHKNMEVKPGGEWRFMFHGPDGRNYPNKIVYVEVVKPERIVYEHSDDGDTEPVNFRSEITFEARGDKTFLTMRGIFPSEEELDRLEKEHGAIEGGKQTLNRLGEYLSKMYTVMQPGAFTIERIFNASVARVWKAITDKDEMKKWYFDLPEFRAEKGCEFRFYGGKDPGRPYLHICKVTEVVAMEKLTYSWRYDGYSGNSLVTFELFPEEGKTRLRLMHSGLLSFPADNPDFDPENFAGGWTYLVGTALAEFLAKQN
ncbi:MAG TPA: SRPBCC family protein [Bacteroidia bacterium]|nr:SRPBCC family protein [Bacteroidia bacterium]